MKRYYAHISENGKSQSVLEHLENVAQMAQDFSIEEFKNVNFLCGLLHDLGKYSSAFQEHLQNPAVRVEHSICGAKEVRRFCEPNSPLELLLQLCIAGHHTGLPDCGTKADTDDQPTLYGRLKRKTEDYSVYQSELSPEGIYSQLFKDSLCRDCKTRKDLVEKFAFLVRYCFSCLVDADSLDTAIAMENAPVGRMLCDFPSCTKALDDRFDRFCAVTALQAARNQLQKQAFANIESDAEVYLMNMPTGSGKTLASMRCALRRIEKSNGRLKRIIYVIPYNSIIDQTVETFEGVFGEHADILRHQSSFVYEEREQKTEDYAKIAKYACENWDAEIIVTTSVQFFESLYGCNRSKLRKLHNLADSVIVLDEAHLMPRDYLEPCLRGISYISRCLHSEILFLTATMPDYHVLLRRYAIEDLKIADLITDTSAFACFQKCRYSFSGTLSDIALTEEAKHCASSLIVMNSRKGAADIFKLCDGEKYHLSTYMTAYDREQTIRKIRNALSRLYEDFPDSSNVPPERRITVVSTSLIEAGVDLDFVSVFRELSGLDSVLQAGGRCNREGLRETGQVFVFEREEKKPLRPEQELTRGIFAEFSDISAPEAIRVYYERLLNSEADRFGRHSISRDCEKINLIPFRTYSEQFRIIDDRTAAIAVCRDAASRELYDTLRQTGRINNRKIRKYCCTVYLHEFEQLLQQRVVEDHGSGVFFLTDPAYYDGQLGIQIEGKDYIV